MIGGDALQAADRNRFRFDASTPTGGLARPVADSAQDPGEDVRLAIDEVRFAELT